MGIKNSRTSVDPPCISIFEQYNLNKNKNVNTTVVERTTKHSSQTVIEIKLKLNFITIIIIKK